jgi:uncharacterized membrane protein
VHPSFVAPHPFAFEHGPFPSPAQKEHDMLPLILEFTGLFVASLLVGAMFCVWLFLNPAHLDASHYVILQQQGIRTLHPALPRLGAVAIALTLPSAFLARHNTPRMSLLIAAVIFFIISGAITGAVNMPINRNVIQWSNSAPPDNWTSMRDRWWHWHKLRAASGILGLALLLIATLACNPTPTGALASLISIRSMFSAFLGAISLLL